MLNAGDGLLIWEAVRRSPEGVAYACAKTQTEASILKEQAQALPELMRPIVLHANFADLTKVLTAQAKAVKFDRIIGRNVLGERSNKSQLVQTLQPWLADAGKLILAETIPRQAQRLSQLFDPEEIGTILHQKWVDAEANIYQSASDPKFNWDATTIQTLLKKADFKVDIHLETLITPVYMR